MHCDLQFIDYIGYQNSASGILDFTIDGDNLYIVDDAGGLFRHDAYDGHYEATVTTGLSNSAGGIVIVNSASAVISDFDNARIQVVQLNSGYKQNYTSTADKANSEGDGQIAVQGNNVMASAFTTAGTINKFNWSTFTASIVTVSGISSSTCKAIIAKDDTSDRFLAAFNDTSASYIKEIDASGTVYKTITLPQVPGVFLTTYKLAYSNNILTVFAFTAGPVLLVYDYATSTILQWHYSPQAVISNIASGVQIMTCGPFFTTFSVTASGSFVEDAAFTGWNVGMNKVSISPALRRLYVAATIGQNTGMFVYKTPDYSTASVETKTIDSGSEVTSRIIRIMDHETRSQIYSDQNVAAGTVSLPARKGARYYELSLRSGKWDWRRFNV